MTEIKPRIALTLSGGGFRASIFHLGVLRRLAEAKWLDKIDVISTVSGGSIVGAFAALGWKNVLENGGNWPALKKYITVPFLRSIQEHNFIADWCKLLPLVLFKKKDKSFTRTKLAALLLGNRFYSGKLCDELPDKPLLVINATCLASIRSWRFTKYGLGDSRFGHANWDNNVLPVGECVGASAAFPPVFTPARIDGAKYKLSGPIYKGEKSLPEPAFFSLSDGGVYENLGTEVIIKENGTQIPVNKKIKQPKYLIVSDAGYPPQFRFRKNGIPGLSEFFLLYRVNDIARTQVNALRIRSLIDEFKDPKEPLKGVLVSLGSDTAKTLCPPGVDHYDDYYNKVGEQHRIPDELVEKIQGVRTHLDKFSPVECEALMYHAYTIADTTLWNFRDQYTLDDRVSDDPGPEWKIDFTENKKKEWEAALCDSDKKRIFKPR